MAFSAVFLIIVSVSLLALYMGTIVLQIHLSKREAVWPGLILPVITFLFALAFPLNMAVPAGGADAAFLIALAGVWAIGNIPTFVFLAIYFAQRRKQKILKELENMNPRN